jgi:putative transposase
MTALFIAVLASFRAATRSRLELAAEILALRHQLAVLHRTTPKRPRLRPIDRLLWMLLSTLWPNWRQAVQIVTRATVVGWHRRAFAAYWRWNSRHRRVGRPALGSDLRAFDSPDAGIEPSVGRSTHPRRAAEARNRCVTGHRGEVSRASRWSPVPVVAHLPQQSRLRARLDRLLTVPTATLRVLFVFVVLSHDRRRIIHVNVTAHPTAAWTAQQLREAWPWDTAPRFVIRDRDALYGLDPRRT